jgi:single-strand DNA-binding protein
VVVESYVTICGNVVAEPARRSTGGGVAVTGFRVASTPRRYDRSAGDWKDGPTLFINVTVWRGLADNVAASLGKGDPVLLYGRLLSRDWNDQEGQPRHVIEVEAFAVGPDLARSTCRVQRRSTGYRAADPSYVDSLAEGGDIPAEYGTAEDGDGAGAGAAPGSSGVDEPMKTPAG